MARLSQLGSGRRRNFTRGGGLWSLTKRFLEPLSQLLTLLVTQLLAVPDDHDKYEYIRTEKAPRLARLKDPQWQIFSVVLSTVQIRIFLHAAIEVSIHAIQDQAEDIGDSRPEKEAVIRDDELFIC